MSSNFKKSWSFWGGRKRINHNFNNSLDAENLHLQIRPHHRFETNSFGARNTFGTRSLREDRNRILFPHDFQHPADLHEQWRNNLQRSCGFNNVDSPHRVLSRSKYESESYPSSSSDVSQHKPSSYAPEYVNIPNQAPYMDVSFNEDLDEPVYENLEMVQSKQPSLLPRPNFPNQMPVHHNALNYERISPKNIPKPPLLPLPNRIVPYWQSVQENVQVVGSNAEEAFNKGGTKFNKAIQGICTSVRSLSQKFKKTTKRQYKFDDSPCTPKMVSRPHNRVTPGKLVPFDVNTPITPHSYRKGPKRLQANSGRRFGKENFSYIRTPNQTNRNNPNWVQFHSPRHAAMSRYRQY